MNALCLVFLVDFFKHVVIILFQLVHVFTATTGSVALDIDSAALITLVIIILTLCGAKLLATGQAMILAEGCFFGGALDLVIKNSLAFFGGHAFNIGGGPAHSNHTAIDIWFRGESIALAHWVVVFDELVY